MSPSFLDDYEPVAHRIDRFYKKHPKGRILTDLILEASTDKTWVVKASIYREDDPNPAATGYAQEVIGSTPVNKSSALENCETSAIGRALANLNYASKDARPSREEMVTVSEYQDPVPPPTPSWENQAKQKVLNLHDGHKKDAVKAFDNAITYLEGTGVVVEPFTEETYESVVLAVSQARAAELQKERGNEK